MTATAALAHDYELEPPDEIIAELQSTVVSRRRGTRSRAELLEDLVAATRELPADANPQQLIRIAAIAVLLRMGVVA